MKEQRKTDQEPRTWFRTDRFFVSDGKWYFSTRERTTEGPFKSIEEAESMLILYIKVANSGYAKGNNTLDLELQPL